MDASGLIFVLNTDTHKHTVVSYLQSPQLRIDPTSPTSLDGVSNLWTVCRLKTTSRKTKSMRHCDL